MFNRTQSVMLLIQIIEVNIYYVDGNKQSIRE